MTTPAHSSDAAPSPATSTSAPAAAAAGAPMTLYGGVTSRRVTVRDLQLAKDRGEKWAMLTSYDMLTAAIFDEAGIPVLLVG
ncbi:MAG: 3-methyl-2-oxobutanoate hydroxymethyltransferase, partial [Frankiaceae bacterium]|nr:3-methyl-2-oxobutanoate hydroxymethyltransferase [Frankiaceae bacterium]